LQIEVETLHICKPPQGFAFGIRKEFGPPRRPLGPLARNILGGIAVARLGAPKDSRAIYLPPAISLRRRHATSSSRGFFIARLLHRATAPFAAATQHLHRDASLRTPNTDCDLALRAKFFGRMARGKKFRERT